MADEAFGELIAFSDVEDKVLAHYKKWMHTWLSARERKLGIVNNTITRPRSYIVKQAFTALPGQESTPLVIVVSDGFATEPARRGDGAWDAWLRFGIAVMCMGTDGSARALCGHYQTAIVGIATRHRAIDDGSIVMNDFGNLRIEDIDEESLGRSMAAVRMEVVYRVQDFSGETPVPKIEIPPEEPHPDDPPVHTVQVAVENRKANEPV